MSNDSILPRADLPPAWIVGDDLPRFAPPSFVTLRHMFVYKEINNVAFEIFGLPIRWYGLMYVAGFAAAWWLGRVRAKKPDSGWTVEQVDDLIFYCALGVIVGGRIGYMLFYGHAQLIENPLSLFYITQGGMSFHGGLLGVLGAMWIFSRRYKKNYFQIGDFVTPLIPLGLGFGRIGNFINGELWGGPTDPDAPWAVIVNGQALHASQLYEAFLEGLVLFLILWIYSSKPRPERTTGGLFLVFYGVFRFIIEFVRVPDEYPGYLAWDWLTMGQLLSAPMIVAGIVIVWSGFARQKRMATGKEAATE